MLNGYIGPNHALRTEEKERVWKGMQAQGQVEN